MPQRHFIVTRGQKAGIAGLSLIIVLLVLISELIESPGLKDPFDVDPASLNYFVLNKEKPAKEKKFSSNDPAHRKTTNKHYKKTEITAFDPNQLDMEGFENIGFSEKQAAVIINYRDQFGWFKTKEDFAKLYVVSEEKFEQLEPHIAIDPGYLAGMKVSTELNAASMEELQKIKGIGPMRAEKIIKYREALGGFVAEEQLSEVYGLDDKLIESIKDQISVDIKLVEKLNINTVTKKKLMHHPYIDFEMAALIIKERDQHPIADLDFLEGAVDNDKLEKLKSYIRFR